MLLRVSDGDACIVIGMGVAFKVLGLSVAFEVVMGTRLEFKVYYVFLLLRVSEGDAFSTHIHTHTHTHTHTHVQLHTITHARAHAHAHTHTHTHTHTLRLLETHEGTKASVEAQGQGCDQELVDDVVILALCCRHYPEHPPAPVCV